MQIGTHAAAAGTAPKPFYRQLYFQVVTAIILGVTVGHFWPDVGASLKPLGDAFVKLVKMIIAPVIFLTVTTGIAGMSDLKKVGRVAGKAMLYFVTFSTLALVVGLIVGNFIQPGAGLNIDPASLDGVGGRRLRRQGARHHGRRLPERHHPDDGGQRLRRGQHPAGAVLLGPVRHRARRGRRARHDGPEPSPGHDEPDVQAGRDPDEGGPDRRLRRHGLHHRQVRHRLGDQPRDAGRHLLPDRADLRGSRARHRRPGGTASRSSS